MNDCVTYLLKPQQQRLYDAGRQGGYTYVSSVDAVNARRTPVEWEDSDRERERCEACKDEVYGRE